jgi:glycosyltransferase involved in cell wall biosynthesis
MLGVADSFLAERYDIVPFTTTRPVSPKIAAVYGYRSMLRGGITHFLASALVTAKHIAMFPFALHRADAVQVQASDFQAFWESALYVVISRLAGKPVIMRIGGSFDYFYSASSARAQALIRCVLQWPDLLIVQSEYWRKLAGELGRATDVVVLPNWISDRVIAPAHTGNEIPVCMFLAGSEAKHKGSEEILGAMRALKAAGARVRFRILAAAPSLSADIEREGLSDMAAVEGFVSHDRVLDAMRSADIFLLPSRGEGFPNSLLEAMASGAAAIVTPVGAVPEIVGDGAGVIIPVRDSDALTAAIVRLSGDQEFRQGMAHLAQTRLRACYTERVVLPVLEQAWTSLLRSLK